MEEVEQSIANPNQSFYQKHAAPIIIALLVTVGAVGYLAIHKSSDSLGKYIKTDSVEALYILQPFGNMIGGAALKDCYEHGLIYRVPYRIPVLDSLGKPKLDSLKKALLKDTLVSILPKYVHEIPIAIR